MHPTLLLLPFLPLLVSAYPGLNNVRSPLPAAVPQPNPNPDPIACPPASSLPDGGFESGLPWLGQPLTSIKPVWTTSNQHSGMRALQLGVRTRIAGGSFELWQYIPVCPGASYTFTAWAKTEDVLGACTVRWEIDALGVATHSGLTTEYAMVTALWVAPLIVPHTLILRVRMQCDPLSIVNVVYLDDVSLEPVV